MDNLGLYGRYIHRPVHLFQGLQLFLSGCSLFLWGYFAFYGRSSLYGCGNLLKMMNFFERGDEVMEAAQLDEIFRPMYQRRLQEVQERKDGFVYYTSAKAGLQILKEREVWMRAAACMNDYREIHYGIQLLNHAIHSSPERSARLAELGHYLDWPQDIMSKLLQKLMSDENYLVTKTFLTCISEHDAALEDEHGRLSMWRAYGRKTGVAFVLNAKAVLENRHYLPITVSPVQYRAQADFDRDLDLVLAHVAEHITVLQQADRKQIMQYFIDTILSSVFSIKHPGFREEREWRLIYREDSRKLAYDLVSIDGVPQLVYKLPLAMERTDAGHGLHALLDHLIIGPTQYADVIYNAFVRALEELGFEDAAQRVCKSNIPLR